MGLTCAHTTVACADEAKAVLMTEVTALLADHAADDLIVVPLLKTCDTLIANACLDSLIDSTQYVPLCTTPFPNCFSCRLFACSVS